MKIILIAIICSSDVYGNPDNLYSFTDRNLVLPEIKVLQAVSNADSLTILTKRLYSLLIADDVNRAVIIADHIEKIIKSGYGFKEESLSYSLFLVGLRYTKTGDAFKSLSYYRKALILLEEYPSDTLAAKVNYNMGISYIMIGDYIKSESYFLNSAGYVKKVFGENAPVLAERDYLSLSIANINIRNYEKAIDYANMGLAIANSKPDSVSPSSIAFLYQTKGTALAQISDYSQAVLNLSRALRIYEENLLPADDYYVNLIDNLASVNYYLGNMGRSVEIFEKGLRTFTVAGRYASFSLSRNYAAVLGKQNLQQKGEKVLSEALTGMRYKFDTKSREYTEALSSYADYLREYDLDQDRSLKIYLLCFDYLKRNPWDLNLSTSISLGYAMSLLSVNKPETALDSVNSILFRDAGLKKPADLYENPDATLLNLDRKTLDILNAKLRILKSLSATDNSINILKSEANTAELVIRIIEDIRLNIGEEQSRLLLGDRYRDAYLNVISSFISCYKMSGERIYLEKAFEYSERSKASSLLASMREMKAMKYFIPAELIAAERKAYEEVSFYSARLEEESNMQLPDGNRLDLWENNLFKSVTKRDSLKLIFEKNYSGYYDLKYNTSVKNINEIQELTGRKKDYISYVVSDTLLYILVLNRKNLSMETVSIDTSFKSLIFKYRKLLSEPDKNSNARVEYELFQRYGYMLYSCLVKPVSSYFVSENLIISPDNLLAFFPFETLITSGEIKNDLYYSRLPYLMNDFNISYAYSATLLAESDPVKPTFRNSTLAFAPSYKKKIFVDSISVNRQINGGILTDLRYAPDEAGFVSKLTSGVLYLGDSATKKVYTDEAGKFDVLHLAMHTVLKSRDPMNSGMIFAGVGQEEDRYLRPFEIYSVPLNAKMVVLSSCYTGAGTMYAGEGVLSIARGFIYSGSRSVVMSLWEVDDRAGTEIVKEFYRNLKSGKQKSDALRGARLSYLKKADMLRAHPYYWSTLLVYGDNSPLYISRFTRALMLLVPLLLGVYVFSYLRKR